MATQLLPSIGVRQKGLMLAGVFALAAWIAYPQLVQQSVAPPVTPSVVKPARSFDNRQPMPSGFQQSAVIRDPFQMPNEDLPPGSLLQAMPAR